jgi:hypothetical protein
MDASSVFWPTDARLFQGITSTTRAADSPHRPSLCWLRPCVIEAEKAISDPVTGGRVRVWRGRALIGFTVDARIRRA